MNDNSTIFEKFENVKKRGANSFQARCPCHDDKTNSLSIKREADKVLIYCHAGCNTKDILTAVGLHMRDLYPSTDNNYGNNYINNNIIYDYFNLDGELVHQTIRTPDKKFFQRRPDGNGGIINGLNAGKYGYNAKSKTWWKYDEKKTYDEVKEFNALKETLLYRLPKFVESVKKSGIAIIVEGEKDCDNMHEFGFSNTTTIPSGADKWKKHYNKYLEKAKWIVIIPDNDEPGRKYAKSLEQEFGHKLIILTLPELPPKGDVSDWISYGKSKEELEKLIENAIKNREGQIQTKILPQKFPFVTFDDKKMHVVVSMQLFIEWINSNKRIFLDNFKIIAGSLRIFSGKYWKIAFDEDIKSFLFSYFEQEGIILQNRYLAEALEILDHFEYEEIDIPFDPTCNIAIPFNNGTLYYNFEKSSFTFSNNYKKNDYALFHLKFNYEPWIVEKDKWVNSFIGNSLNATYSDQAIDAIQMFFASVFIPHLNHQKSLYIYGELGGEGKGLISSTFSSFFNSEVTSSLNVSKWDKTHENIALANSILNISNEITSREIGTVVFKSVIAQDMITFNPKFQSPIKVKPLTKHIFTANLLPRMEIGSAELRRFIFIEAKRRHKILDPTFGMKYEKNKQYLLSFALCGIEKLYRNNFRIDYSDKDLTNRLITENESLSEFLDEVLDLDVNSYEDIKDLYGEFKDWRYGSEHPVRPMTKASFAKRLNKLLNSLNVEFSTDRRRERGKLITFYKGIKIKKKI